MTVITMKLIALPKKKKENLSESTSESNKHVPPILKGILPTFPPSKLLKEVLTLQIPLHLASYFEALTKTDVRRTEESSALANLISNLVEHIAALSNRDNSISSLSCLG